MQAFFNVIKTCIQSSNHVHDMGDSEKRMQTFVFYGKQGKKGGEQSTYLKMI